jgi:hypothetical protein
MARLTHESLKQRMESKGGGDSLPIVRVKKDEPLVVRFLTEPTEWSVYDEYYDSDARKSYVVHAGQFAPAEVRVTTRYLANVLVVDSDKVLALMMPTTLAQRLYNRWSVSKKNTIMDRDFELARMGEGLKTTYMEAPEAPHSRPLDKYELLDLEDVIARMDAVPGAPRTASTGPAIEVDDEGVYDDEPAPAPRTRNAKGEQPFPEPEEKPAPVMTEEEAFPDEDEEYWTIAELEAMTEDEVREVALTAGIKGAARFSREQLVQMLGV